MQDQQIILGLALVKTYAPQRNEPNGRTLHANIPFPTNDGIYRIYLGQIGFRFVV
ncbi:hypothetical protein AB4114_20910 [Paenibacillus sp. 2RAB27]|uniref:hypothetical protein n=1 Tax=Paenibacillus sp. 2RAB27 TaxID=3232991 RepID=UPI003F9850A5